MRTPSGRLQDEDARPPAVAPAGAVVGRSVLGIVTGLVVGFAIIFGVETLNGALHPPPAGIDPGDLPGVRKAMADLPASALIIVLGGWALGSFVAGFVAAKFGGRSPTRNALIVGGILMAAGITNLLMLPHPVWFNGLALIVFLPPARAGARLAVTATRFHAILMGVTLLVPGQTPLTSQSVPAPRAHHQLVHHPGNARTYLIGGSTRRDGGYHYFDEMWSWDGARWTQAAALPFPRSSHRVTYHVQRNSLILFGGGFAQAVRAEGILWEWSSGEWKAIGGDFRGGASEPEMCYDRSRDRIVIFGGWDAANAFRGATWEWQVEGLVRVDSAGPGPRAGHVFLYDPVRHRCLLFGGQGTGGYLADTWAWDGSTWHELEVEGPSPRWFSGSATDLEAGRVVIFGGRGPAPVPGRDASGDLGDTWAWDGERWELLTTAGPSSRSNAQLAFTGNSIILFGGREERPDGFHDRNDLWELRGRSWTRRH